MTTEQKIIAQMVSAKAAAYQWQTEPVIVHGTDHDKAIVVVRRTQWNTEGDDVNPRPWECPATHYAIGRIEQRYDHNDVIVDGIVVYFDGNYPLFLTEATTQTWIDGAIVHPYSITYNTSATEERYAYIILGKGETPAHYDPRHDDDDDTDDTDDE